MPASSAIHPNCTGAVHVTRIAQGNSGNSDDSVGRLGSLLVPVVSAVVVRRGDGAARVPDRGQVRKL